MALTKRQAKTIRDAIHGGEVLSFLGLAVTSEKYEAALSGLSQPLRKAHYKGSKRFYLKRAAHYQTVAPVRDYATSVTDIWNANLAI